MREIEIKGDVQLSRIIKVGRNTIKKWRDAGRITGERITGKPSYYLYNWHKVSREILENAPSHQVKIRIKRILKA